MDSSQGICCKEKSLPIPLQQFFFAAIPICQNYFKKEKGKETRIKTEKKEVRKRVERRNKYQEMKEREKENEIK